MSLGVSFEFCLRRREDVPMRRRCYILLRRPHDVLIRCRGDVPLRCLGDVPSTRRWAFHLRRNCDVARTYRETSLRRRQDVLLPGGTIRTGIAYKEIPYYIKAVLIDRISTNICFIAPTVLLIVVF